MARKPKSKAYADALLALVPPSELHPLRASDIDLGLPPIDLMTVKSDDLDRMVMGVLAELKASCGLQASLRILLLEYLNSRREGTPVARTMLLAGGPTGKPEIPSEIVTKRRLLTLLEAEQDRREAHIQRARLAAWNRLEADKRRA